MDNDCSQTSENLSLVEWALAVNPSTPSHILDGLLRHERPALLERIAEHPQASANALTVLSQHQCSTVRAAVAENLNTPQQIVFDLAQDQCLDVRYSIAENPHMPLVVLDMLADDDNPYVAYRARLTIRRVQHVPRMPVPLPELDEIKVYEEGIG